MIFPYDTACLFLSPMYERSFILWRKMWQPDRDSGLWNKNRPFEKTSAAPWQHHTDSPSRLPVGRQEKTLAPKKTANAPIAMSSARKVPKRPPSSGLFTFLLLHPSLHSRVYRLLYWTLAAHGRIVFSQPNSGASPGFRWRWVSILDSLS